MTIQTLDAYILCEKLPDGTSGKPVGISSIDPDNADGAMLIFEQMSEAEAVRELIAESSGRIGLFKVHVRMIGEVVA